MNGVWFCVLLYVHHENITLVGRQNHCLWLPAHFKPTHNTYCFFLTEKDLFRAIAFTSSLSFSVSTEWLPKVCRILRQARVLNTCISSSSDPNGTSQTFMFNGKISHENGVRKSIDIMHLLRSLFFSMNTYNDSTELLCF